MTTDLFTYELIRRRASYPVYLKYGINKQELGLLCQLCGLLRHYDRQIAAKEDLFSQITANTREKRKMEGYLLGLLNRGFVGSYEYIHVPGSLCLGISDLGLSVLNAYHSDIQRMQERYKAKRLSYPLSLSLRPQERYRLIKLVAV